MSGTRAGALKGWRTRRRNERLIVNRYKKIAANEHTKTSRAMDEYFTRSELRGEYTPQQIDKMRYAELRSYEEKMRGTKPSRPRRRRGR